MVRRFRDEKVAGFAIDKGSATEAAAQRGV
jgi:hypothetical protein